MRSTRRTAASSGSGTSGQPVPLSSLPCGNIDPLGITGTPVVDLPSRALLFDAMTTPDNGATKQHLIYSLNVDTGTTNSGWPVDVNATASLREHRLHLGCQNERGALAVLGGIVYVPYGGHCRRLRQFITAGWSACR